jgi:hypothetical protein
MRRIRYSNTGKAVSGKLSPVWELAAFVILLRRLSRVGCAASFIIEYIHPEGDRTMKTVTSATLLFALCGIAAAQSTATYTGEHYTGAVCPSSPNGETSCAYVGNITNDPAAAYAWITDTTGVNFPSIQPRGTPPTVNLTGVWNASLAWNNGMETTGTTTVVGGTCTVQGGPTGPRVYSVVYTVSCSGTDTKGNPASKMHVYYVYFKTSRAGGFWQPPTDGIGTTMFNIGG